MRFRAGSLRLDALDNWPLFVEIFLFGDSLVGFLELEAFLGLDDFLGLEEVEVFGLFAL